MYSPCSSVSSLVPFPLSSPFSFLPLFFLFFFTFSPRLTPSPQVVEKSQGWRYLERKRTTRVCDRGGGKLKSRRKKGPIIGFNQHHCRSPWSSIENGVGRRLGRRCFRREAGQGNRYGNGARLGNTPGGFSPVKFGDENCKFSRWAIVFSNWTLIRFSRNWNIRQLNICKQMLKINRRISRWLLVYFKISQDSSQ